MFFDQVTSNLATKTSTPSGQQQEFTLMENFAILH